MLFRSLERGKTYNFNLTTSLYNFYLTTDPAYSQIDPLGVTNNGAPGATGGLVTINVNPQEQNVIYYYSSVNTQLRGSINIVNSPISDLGNTSLPLDFNQRYNPVQNSDMQTAISNFYYLKENGEIKSLGDETYDPVQFVDPTTGIGRAHV